MKKLLSILSISIFSVALLFSFSGCYGDSFVPKEFGDSLGMYLYDGTMKMLVNNNGGQQIIEQVEYDGVVYNITITDHRYSGDYFYFCAEFDDNNFVGLFRYDFTDRLTDSLL